MKYSIHSSFKTFSDVLKDRVLSSIDTESINEVQGMLDIFIGEAEFTIKFIEPHLSKELRVLEVGSGLCILSCFLKLEGFNITALEPIQGGFDPFIELQKKIINIALPNDDLTLLEKPAEALSSEVDGEFDFIFSNNVLEHIPEIEQALISLKNVLSSDGLMVHHCPNYIVPYEPHFGFPVFAFFPYLTELIWRNKVSSDKELWDSLNFITSFKLSRICNKNSIAITFKSRVGYEVFLRLRDDENFKERHQSILIKSVSFLLFKCRLISLLKFVPPKMITPMIFYLKHQ